MTHVFPFTALVGQEQMKLALVLNAINPRIGGVLIRGEKGTAKSTAVRALANLLPQIEVTPGCPYACTPGEACPLAEDHAREARKAARKKTSLREGETLIPALSQKGRENTLSGRDMEKRRRPVQIVELPVGATEDRLIGSLDIGKALSKGSVRFKPGLLAAANRGVLYVDEVNLLNDHLVDVLLDAAAMGRNYVEREGISFEHGAQFILVGTMNPEEGDLRPQLLDRFALAVEVEGRFEPGQRAEVVRRRIAFEADPVRFARQWAHAEQDERRRISRAQRLLRRVKLSARMLDAITRICADFQVDGLRADIVMYKTAQTLAAYEGRTKVREDDVRRAAELALPHRRRRQPFESPEMERQELDDAIRDLLASMPPEPDSREPSDDDPGAGGAAHGSDEDERVYDVGRRFKPASVAASRPGVVLRPRSGRRTKLLQTGSRGHYVGSRPPVGEPSDIAFDATFRAAASRGARSPEVEDLRVKVRETRLANLIVFAVDASGSMAAADRMVAAKGAVLSLLLDAYQKRDQVGMIAFRGRSSELLLPPTNSVDLAEKQLRTLPTGGRTPLSHALQQGLDVIRRHRTLHREAVPLFVLISDGRPNVPLAHADPLAEAAQIGSQFAAKHIQSVVVDTEAGGLRLGLARQLALAMGGQYLRLDELEAGRLAGAVRMALGRTH